MKPLLLVPVFCCLAAQRIEETWKADKHTSKAATQHTQQMTQVRDLQQGGATAHLRPHAPPQRPSTASSTRARGTPPASPCSTGLRRTAPTISKRTSRERPKPPPPAPRLLIHCFHQPPQKGRQVVEEEEEVREAIKKGGMKRWASRRRMPLTLSLEQQKQQQQQHVS